MTRTMTKNKKIKIEKIVFYTSVPRMFRTTLIGHLYEIAQVYPVILLSEKLDPETEEIVNNKKLFPKLEKIISVRQYENEKRGLLAKNKYLYKLAKDIIYRCRPDIVISANDFCPFELYLMRLAKRVGSINICLQAGVHVETAKVALFVNLMKANTDFPSFLPFWLRLGVLKVKRYLGHILYYWILPLSVGELPFWGKSSMILWRWVGGLQEADYSVVFSKRDYDIHFKDGVPREKIYILAHPLMRETKKFFEKAFFSKYNQEKKDNKRIAVLMLPSEEIGVKKDNFSLISKEERKKTRRDIINLVVQKLTDWQIFIKPHPAIENIDETRKIYQSLSERIKIIEPSEPVDKYIEIADLVIGLPSPNTTALYSALLQHPSLPILALDFNQELLGDIYQNFKGIEYVDRQEKLIDILTLIRNNNYQKKYNKSELELNSFSNVVRTIEHLWNQKN